MFCQGLKCYFPFLFLPLLVMILNLVIFFAIGEKKVNKINAYLNVHQIDKYRSGGDGAEKKIT